MNIDVEKAAGYAEERACPFCREDGFDGVGLKVHLSSGHCETYEATPSPARTVRLDAPAFSRSSRPAASGEAVRPEVVCLCGSTRFIDAFTEQYGRLTDEGKIVLSVGRVVPQSEQALGSARKVALDELHLRKIDLCDRVLVLNVGGYVGQSTRREIAYAAKVGKPIDLLYPDAGLDGPAPAAPAKCAEEQAVHDLLNREYKRAQEDFRRRMADVASDPLPRDLILKMPIHGRAAPATEAKCPSAGASEGEGALRCPASRDEVVAYLREVAFHDSTLPEPTDAMIDRVWAICRETRTLGTVAVLAVRMWEAEENIRRALRPTPPPAEVEALTRDLASARTALEEARGVVDAARTWRDSRSPNVSDRAHDLFAAIDAFDALVEPAP